MDLKRIAKDTTRVLSSYLTYQAVRTVLSQLLETNRPVFHQFNEFASREKLQDGEAFITELLKEYPELGLRVMTVRSHLAEEIAEFLPEMLTSSIQQSNIEHRKKQLEKMTQMTSEELSASVEKPSADKNSPNSEASSPDSAED
ncbi:MAG: chaperonin family protein RbcX [Phormidesmis sp.]